MRCYRCDQGCNCKNWFGYPVIMEACIKAEDTGLAKISSYIKNAGKEGGLQPFMVSTMEALYRAAVDMPDRKLDVDEMIEAITIHRQQKIDEWEKNVKYYKDKLDEIYDEIEEEITDEK